MRLAPGGSGILMPPGHPQGFPYADVLPDDHRRGLRSPCSGTFLQFRNEPFVKVLKSIEKQSGYTFIYGKNQLDNAKPVTVNLRTATLKEALEACFKNQPLTYALQEPKFIVIQNRTILYSSPGSETPNAPVNLAGRVTDEDGAPMPGVTVRAVNNSPMGVTRMTTTDEDGRFVIPMSHNPQLIFSFIGYEPLPSPPNLLLR